MSERRKSKRLDSERNPASSRTGGIPVFGLVDLKKNRDFRLIKQDLEERGRLRDREPAAMPAQRSMPVRSPAALLRAMWVSIIRWT